MTTEEELEELVADARAHFKRDKRRARKAARKIRRWTRIKAKAARGRKHWREIWRNRRRRLKRKRNRFDPAMLNGYPDTITDKAKQEIVIQVNVYNLYVTSTSRSWGGSSHHESRPTPGNDCAGSLSNMIAYQKWLYDERRPELLEHFGPHNTYNSKNGAPLAQAEGSSNEDLHDNHCHQMWR